MTRGPPQGTGRPRARSSTAGHSVFFRAARPASAPRALARGHVTPLPPPSGRWPACPGPARTPDSSKQSPPMPAGRAASEPPGTPPARRRQGLWAAREGAAPLPQSGPGPGHRGPTAARSFHPPPGPTLHPELTWPWCKAGWVTPRHRRTDQSQHTKHTMTTTRSRGSARRPRCGLCFAGRGGGGRGREGRGGGGQGC